MSLGLPDPRTRTVRVLVVDDSVVARRVVCRALEGEAGIEVVGVAANGRLALDKVVRGRPDVVVLDLEMPVMDGFETLRALRSSHPDLPVIVFSRLGPSGGGGTVDPLAMGASAFVAKPSAEATALDAGHVATQLVPLVKALGAEGRAVPVSRLASGDRPVIRGGVGSAEVRRAAILVVASSTGGPNALAAITASLPADLAVPVLVVQHMPAAFTGQLADRLDRAGPLPAAEAVAGEPVRPGRVYIAQGGRHLGVVRTPAGVFISVPDGPPENSCRPAADVLFRSAVEAYGDAVLGLVLTGMGRDGLRGAEAIRAAGGMVITQDQATAVVGSMPGAVAAAGLADAVVPLDGIAGAVARRLTRGQRP